ncbi:hypothetical protein IFR04_015745 [Cadophora malorum]|uniref:Uncharacterized protein n=1 Tax=Cadophora malorum TaxID=108018 RepID=A0A8H7SYD7_9HELO|nr:hypothetical protein IFR04_015745 [Cadophora malorum]
MSASRTSSAACAVLAVLCACSFLISPAVAVNMTYYAPTAEVDAKFATWITAFYTAAEATDPSTEGYSDFFSANATIDLGGWNPAQDVADGLTHYPTTTSILTDNCTEKTFNLQGLTKGYYENNTCEVDSYGTQFTIAKAANGRVELTPRSGSLVFLNLIGQNLSSMLCDAF